MRAAYAALILGLVGGVALATGMLSGRSVPPPTTVAGVLGLDVQGFDVDRRRGEAVAVLVARCMTSHGLSWTPWVEPPPSVPDPDLAPIRWAERWGFGISTMVGRTAAVESDPNVASLGALGPDDRDTLRRKLFGDRDSPGCQAAASDAVFGLRERHLAPMRPLLDQLDGRIAADPQARSLVSAWRSCVSPVSSGMSTVDRSEVPARIMAGISDRLAGLPKAPTAIAGLAALQAEERRSAAVLARCEEAFAAGRAVVAAPYEASFTLEHGDELRRIGAEIRAEEAALATLPPPR